MNVTIIIYTSDQEKATGFYRTLLGADPILAVPGMTEFELNEGTKLGIMPAAGIVRILEGEISEPICSQDHVKCELYLSKENADQLYENSMKAGGISLGGFKLRNWGEEVAYCLDLDGNLIAFARR